MTRPVSQEIIDLCVSLRVNEQWSTPKIAKYAGICNHTVYKILKPYPWRPRGRLLRRGGWTEVEEAILRDIYPTETWPEIERQLPRHNILSIGRHASKLKIRRVSHAVVKNKRAVDPIMKQLWQVRTDRGLTRDQVSEKCGYHRNTILQWELGRLSPRLFQLRAIAEVLGLRILAVEE